MQIDPGLRALRGNSALQRQAQAQFLAARDAWCNQAQWRNITRAFADYDEGAELAACVALHNLFDRPDKARHMADGFIQHFLPVLADAPWGQFPLRHGANGSVSTLLLASGRRAVLSLVMVDGAVLATRPMAQTISLADTTRHEIILGGTATGRRVVVEGFDDHHARLQVKPYHWAPGTRLSFDTMREAMLADRVDGMLISLRLVRFADEPAPARDVAIGDGAIIHQSAGRVQDSRLELMLAVLGRMGRDDAAPAMAAMARSDTSAPALRWQALRECLALDTAQGFDALCALARNAADPLAGAAGALRAQLLEAYPVLNELNQKMAEGHEPCPV